MSLQQLLERYLGRCVAAAVHREQPMIIAVAGSVGKSSTKQAIGVLMGSEEADRDLFATKKNYYDE